MEIRDDKEGKMMKRILRFLLMIFFNYEVDKNTAKEKFICPKTGASQKYACGGCAVKSCDWASAKAHIHLVPVGDLFARYAQQKVRDQNGGKLVVPVSAE